MLALLWGALRNKDQVGNFGSDIIKVIPFSFENGKILQNGRSESYARTLPKKTSFSK